VFIEVLLVTLIIHRVLEERAKKSRLEKLNMVIGAFYSGVGVKLLRILSDADPQVQALQRELSAEGEPADQKYGKIRRVLKKHEFNVENEKQDWETLKTLLTARKDFLLRLLENPNLLEHESFTGVLRAVFHMAEELEARESLLGLPGEDNKHLVNDAKRVYGQLSLQWLEYMEYLKTSYPYLFSLSLRINPFDRSATPIIH
jgi:hypothetical protein